MTKAENKKIADQIKNYCKGTRISIYGLYRLLAKYDFVSKRVASEILSKPVNHLGIVYRLSSVAYDMLSRSEQKNDYNRAVQALSTIL